MGTGRALAGDPRAAVGDGDLHIDLEARSSAAASIRTVAGGSPRWEIRSLPSSPLDQKLPPL